MEPLLSLDCCSLFWFVMASDGSGTRKSGKHGFRLKMAETILVECPKLSRGCVLNSRAAVSMQQYDVSMIHTAKAYSQLSPASMKRSQRTSRTQPKYS